MAEEITLANETTSIETVRETTCSALAFDTTSRAGKVKLFNALNSSPKTERISRSQTASRVRLKISLPLSARTSRTSQLPSSSV